MTKKKKIDINVDLGEGSGNDPYLMPYVSSCNIATGGHAGDESSIQQSIQLAQQHNVKIGAHPSFPDRENFGRKVLDLPQEALIEVLAEQLYYFFSIADSEGVQVHHVKPHGALYNFAAKDKPTTRAIVKALEQLDRSTKLYVPYQSELHRGAGSLYPLEFEAFIDRKYEDKGRLLARSEDGAVITDPEKAWQQLYNMINKQIVTTASGKEVPVVATTFCIHGDSAHAVDMLRYIRKKMKEHEITMG